MILRNPFAEVSMAEVSLPQYVLQQAQARGSKAALIDGLSGRTISYAQLWTNVRHVARSLVQRGYRKGDVFAIYSPNLPEYAVAFHAIATLGGVVTTANPRGTVAELAGQLKETGAKCLLTTSPLLDRATQAAAQSAVREVYTFDHAEGAKPFAELCESVLAAHELPSDALIDPRRDLAALSYSLNGSGLPKVVLRTHHRLVEQLARFAAVEALTGAEVFLGVLPFVRGYGMLLLLNYALAQGATVVTLPHAEPKLCLATLQKYRVTRAPMAPPLDQTLVQHPAIERYDLSAWWKIYLGAEPPHQVGSNNNVLQPEKFAAD